MKKKLVSIVLNSFVNDNRVLKEAKTLAKAGFDVTVSALQLKGEPLKDTTPEFKVRRIRVVSRALPRGKLFGIIKYSELVLKTIWRYRKYEVWHCNDFEPLVMASILKCFKRDLVIVYDAHEYAREKNGLGGLEKSFVAKLEPRLIRYCNEIITVSQGIAAEYKRLYGLDNVHIIYNAPHQQPQLTKPNKFRQLYNINRDRMIFLYQGQFHEGRGLKLLVDAFEILRESKADLVLMGNGMLEEYLTSAATRISNIHIHQAVPYEEILEYTASADFGLITVENICLSYYYCMPNKMFEYIQAKIPIITTNLHDCRIMVENKKLGLVIPAFTSESFAETIRRALEIDVTQYTHAIHDAANHLHWGTEEVKLTKIYEKYIQ